MPSQSRRNWFIAWPGTRDLPTLSASFAMQQDRSQVEEIQPDGGASALHIDPFGIACDATPRGSAHMANVWAYKDSALQCSASARIRLDSDESRRDDGERIAARDRHAPKPAMTWICDLRGLDPVERKIGEADEARPKAASWLAAS